MDMRKWRTVELDVVDGVLLDPRNVRLELESDDIIQADIIYDLFRNADAFGLVTGITKIGYLTHEIPIVIKRQREYVVVEGNRRVAALKAIQNPYLAGEYQARVRDVASRLADRDALRSIDFKVAPNQDDADQLVAALHTGNLRRPWSPTRQAAFFQAQVDAGTPIDELRRRYPTVQLDKFILRSRIVGFFKSIDYDSPDIEDFVKSKKFNVSTLARLYESKQFRDLTGIGLTETGDLDMSISVDCLTAMAHHIADGMKAGAINTRSIGKVGNEEYRTLLSELTAIRNGSATKSKNRDSSGEASSKSNQPGDSGTTGKPAGNGSDSKTSTSSSKPAKRRRSAYLKCDDFIEVPDSFHPAMKRLVEEISRVSIESHPNMMMDVLRSLLEKSIKAYAGSEGVDIAEEMNLNGYVQLGPCIGWLEKYLKENGDSDGAQVAKNILNNQLPKFGASLRDLNAANHNYKMLVTAEDVRFAWDTMLPLLSTMMPKRSLT